MRHIAETVGFTKEPFVVLFSPEGNTVSLDPFTLEEMEFFENDAWI